MTMTPTKKTLAKAARYVLLARYFERSCGARRARVTFVGYG